ncbi:DNA cytosine methyltransferase [Streptomyces sp. NPDC093598]|uniref:DNA cytosine methyltransferase n=1 Tax=Streptomyces sp. NPDC093598 TaxID=3366046 RepID=UPI0038001684
MTLRIGSLCSGFGGLEMAVQAAFGGHTVFHADPDPGASKILAHHWPKVPNLGDIRFVHWARTVRQYGPIDIAAMGFPCTDLSLAGLGAGIAPGTRSGLWLHCATAIDALNPRYVVIENVRGLLSRPAHCDVEPCPWCMGDADREHLLRALGAVLGDLADLGLDAEWIGLPASHPAVGACHERWRVILLAWRADADPHDLRRDGRTGHLAETQGRNEPADRGHAAAAAGNVTLLPTPAARDWKSGASNLMDANSRPLNEFAVNWLPRRGDWIGTNGIDYGPAIRRWEQVVGRPAPEPTEPGSKGNRRLNPVFSEWMMGAPRGHITAVPGLSREDQLRAIGNGVVWQQGAHALRLLYARATHSLAAAA